MQALRLLVISFLLAGCGGGGGGDSTPPAPIKILFVGNSYTFARVAPALQPSGIGSVVKVFDFLKPQH